jgi:hypothetical protein
MSLLAVRVLLPAAIAIVGVILVIASERDRGREAARREEFSRRGRWPQ